MHIRHKGKTEKENLLAPEPYFRWRAGEITRLEAFCDVVFGFAITLLVVSLEVPRSYAEADGGCAGIPAFCSVFRTVGIDLVHPLQIFPPASDCKTLTPFC